MTHLLILTLRWVRSRSRPLGAMVLLALATEAGPASAQHAGLRTWVVPGNEPITVALFYPTDIPARVVSMGPWQPVVALGATVARAPLKGG